MRAVLGCMSTQLIDDIQAAVRSGELILNSDQRRALSNMQTCRTAERGGKILACQDCGIKIPIYNPCNQRGCSICYEKRQIEWKIKILTRLVPVSHHHLVFSIPQIYTDIWLRNKKAVMDGLFACVSNIIKEVGESYSLNLGSVLVFQSQGRGMTYKPHMHCILTAGGLDENKNWIDVKTLKCTKLEKRLKETLHNEIVKKTVGQFLTVDRHDIDEKEWRVYSTFHEKTGKWIAEYLSHSLAGVVIDMDEGYIDHKENGTVEIKESHNGKQITTILKKTTFLERYLNHIPPASAVTVRSYGLYSNKYKKDLEVAYKQFQDQNEDIEESEMFYERCPVCRGRMVVESEIDIKKIESIMKIYNLGNGPPKHRQILRTA